MMLPLILFRENFQRDQESATGSCFLGTGLKRMRWVFGGLGRRWWQEVARWLPFTSDTILEHY